jgi:hypothetical protein
VVGGEVEGSRTSGLNCGNVGSDARLDGKRDLSHHNYRFENGTTLRLAMNFEIVFDAAEAGYRQWWFPTFGLIFVVIGLGILIYQRKNPSHKRSVMSHVFPYLFTGFAVFWVAFAFIGTFSDYWQLRQALRSGQFEVVEGKVVDFVPMPPSGHAMERFTVNGHHYEYADNVVTAGFNNTQSHGGPIREGLIVRIADVRGKIARLEIAR